MHRGSLLSGLRRADLPNSIKTSGYNIITTKMHIGEIFCQKNNFKTSVDKRASVNERR